MRNLQCKLCLQGLSEINCVLAQVLGGFGANIRNNNYKFVCTQSINKPKLVNGNFGGAKCKYVTSHEHPIQFGDISLRVGRR